MLAITKKGVWQHGVSDDNVQVWVCMCLTLQWSFCVTSGKVLQYVSSIYVSDACINSDTMI